MKKRLFALTCLFILFYKVQAQYVTIPDANFRSYLQATYPSCMSGGMLDTTCTSIVSATSINVANRNISDLSGIRYFDNLLNLDASFNKITYLPVLPKKLTSVNVGFNWLNSLSGLPNSLIHLYCSGNSNLINLPSLPPDLEYLTCNLCGLTSIPALPYNLIYLDFSNNQVTTLPNMAGYNINHLNFTSNLISGSPNIPPSVSRLYCSNNQLTELPHISNLTHLYCSNNKLTSFKYYPFLEELNCSYNQISGMLAFSSSLKILDCSHNQILVLSNFAEGATNVNCSYNNIASFNTFPNSITHLNFSNNPYYGTIGTLPSSLLELNCSYTDLEIIPALPTSLKRLISNNTRLTTLPPLPNGLTYLNCRNSQLKCLPFLPNTLTNLSASGNYINCIPNAPTFAGFTSDIGKTTCEANNTNGCTAYPVIGGSVFVDHNANGLQDSGEKAYPFAKLSIQPGDYILSADHSGSYGLNVQPGTYTVKLYDEAFPHHTSSPNSRTVSIAALDQKSISNHFALQSIEVSEDISLNLTPTGPVRPGRAVGYILTYTNKGTTILSGSLTLAYDNQLTHTESSPVFASQAAGQLSWTYTNLHPGETKQIKSYFLLASTTPLGTLINLSSSSEVPGDVTPENNNFQFAHRVTGSFDPNYKQVLPETDITMEQIEVRGNFIYTVHFQNTGTDTAFVVAIQDTISSNFEFEGIETLASSHNYTFSMKENAATWTYYDILLPDSTTNERLSHGFVTYRIVPKHTLSVGDEIKNTAHIVFDYNEPVKTNTTLNRVVLSTTSLQSADKKDLSVYPNPAKDKIYISTSDKKTEVIRLIDLQGNIIKSFSNVESSDPFLLDLTGLLKGIYFIQLTNQDGLLTKKILLY